MQEKAIQILEDSLIGIRSGGVTPSLVDVIKVPYYGQMTPIKHLANTSPATGKVMVTPFDPNILGDIQKALTVSGFNAYTFSKTAVAVSVPPVTEEQQEKVKAQVKKLGEDAKISIRGARKKARQQLDQKLSKDERLKEEAKIDKVTDDMVATVDRVIQKKLLGLG